jgi:hypothetical protein
VWQLAAFNLVLTMPTWLLLIDLASVRWATPMTVPEEIVLLCFLLFLHAMAVVINMISWAVSLWPLQDWRLNVLRLSNLANSCVFFGVVFLQ